MFLNKLNITKTENIYILNKFAKIRANGDCTKVKIKNITNPKSETPELNLSDNQSFTLKDFVTNDQDNLAFDFNCKYQFILMGEDGEETFGSIFYVEEKSYLKQISIFFILSLILSSLVISNTNSILLKFLGNSNFQGIIKSLMDDVFVGIAGQFLAIISLVFGPYFMGKKLRDIDGYLKDVSSEYEAINKSISKINDEMREVRNKQDGISLEIEQTINRIIPNLQNRWLVGAGSLFVLFSGFFLTAISSDILKSFLDKYGSIVGLGIIAVAFIVLYLCIKKK